MIFFQPCRAGGGAAAGRYDAYAWMPSKSKSEFIRDKIVNHAG